MPEQRKAVGLPNRGVIRVSGDDARDFLDKLITANMDQVTPGKAIHAALLTPQGKIIADFIVTEADTEDGGGFYCDVPLVAVTELVKRLTLYKLRAKVVIEDLSEELGVMAIWGDPALVADSSLSAIDPRHPGMGLRVMGHKSQFDAMAEAYGADGSLSSETGLEAYHMHRATLGIGEAGFDYLLGDAFPHEINMDQLSGVDFRKGCYIGQEVVSRMQHRGTARTRLVLLKTDNGFSVADNIPVMADGRTIGTTGTGFKGGNLAMIRLDRAAEAIEAGHPISAGSVAVIPQKPAWWAADWPIGEMT